MDEDVGTRFVGNFLDVRLYVGVYVPLLVTDHGPFVNGPYGFVRCFL